MYNVYTLNTHQRVSMSYNTNHIFHSLCKTEHIRYQSLIQFEMVAFMLHLQQTIVGDYSTTDLKKKKTIITSV